MQGYAFRSRCAMTLAALLIAVPPTVAGSPPTAAGDPAAPSVRAADPRWTADRLRGPDGVAALDRHLRSLALRLDGGPSAGPGHAARAPYASARDAAVAGAPATGRLEPAGDGRLLAAQPRLAWKLSVDFVPWQAPPAYAHAADRPPLDAALSLESLLAEGPVFSPRAPVRPAVTVGARVRF